MMESVSGPTESFLGHMTWPEYSAALKKNPVVFLPCGATEQHGPHLPLAVDALLATSIALSCASRIGGIVAPGIPYGYRSMTKTGGGPFFPGTTNLSGGTLAAVVSDTLTEFSRHGVSRICVLNGHFENQWFLTEGIHLALSRLSKPYPVIARIEYWSFITDEALKKVFPDGFPEFELEHAALMETSLMLHFHPSLVRADLVPEHGPASFEKIDTFPPNRKGLPDTGVLNPVRGASAEKGKVLAEAAVKGIVEAIQKQFEM